MEVWICHSCGWSSLPTVSHSICPKEESNLRKNIYLLAERVSCLLWENSGKLLTFAQELLTSLHNLF